MKDAVPYVKLSKKEEEKCLALLRRANTILSKWSECFGSRKGREFRKMLFQGHRDATVMKQVEERIPADQIEQFRKERQFIIAIHVTKYPDLENRTVEYAMLCGFSAMARKHARRWFNFNGEGNGLSLSDYLNEAYLCLLDSIYGYTRDDITFATFAWKALQNRMSYVTNKSNLFCPLTNPDLELLTKYEDTKRSFNAPVSFDQVVEAMGLDDEQYDALSAILTKVYSESQLTLTSEDGGDESPEDYTSLRGTMRQEEEENIIKLTVNEAIEMADLTEFERIVLDASMELDPETGEPYYGWMSRVARENINPNTNEPYTRMWVSLALKNAYRKIKAVMVA